MRIFLDFDDTIYKTKQRIYDYMDARGHKLNKGYDVRNMYNSLKDAYGVDEKVIEDMFSDVSFYLSSEEYFHEGALEAIEELLDSGNEVFIATVGETDNNHHKELMMKKIDSRIKFLTKTFVRSEIKNVEDMFDKSMFNMSGGIHLDDNEHCIATSNAEYKFQFGYGVKGWKEFLSKIEAYVEMDCIEIEGAIQYSDGRLATKLELSNDFLKAIEKAGMCFGGGIK